MQIVDLPCTCIHFSSIYNTLAFIIVRPRHTPLNWTVIIPIKVQIAFPRLFTPCLHPTCQTSKRFRNRLHSTSSGNIPHRNPRATVSVRQLRPSVYVLPYIHCTNPTPSPSTPWQTTRLSSQRIFSTINIPFSS